MPFTPDVVRVTIEGRDFTRWTSYDIAADIFSPPASFALEIGRADKETRDLLDVGATLDVHIDVDGVEQLLLAGRIEKRGHSYSKGQHNITISGYDKSRDLMNSTAPFDLKVVERQFVDVCEELVAPWGIEVSLTNELTRFLAAKKEDWIKATGGYTKLEYYAKVKEIALANPDPAAFKAAMKTAGIGAPPHCHAGIVKKVKDAKVAPGESVWDFLLRIANKAEMLMWFSPDGMLIVSRPQYEQDPYYILSHRPDRPAENNVISASQTLDIDGIPTVLAVHGKAREKGKERLPYMALRTSDITYARHGLYRPMQMKDKDARTKAELEKRAWYAMKGAEKNYHTLSYTVAGHSQDSRVWTYDQNVKVVDETLDLNDVFHISGYRMTRSRTNASAGPQQTTLTLQPLNMWVPAP